MAGVHCLDVWCMLQWCLVCDTVMSGVWYSNWWCMIHLLVVCDTVMCGVWYSDLWCIIQWLVVYDTYVICHYNSRLARKRLVTDPRSASSPMARYWADITVSYTRHHCIIHQTSLYHTPDITLSYIRHHCIIHQTSLYDTPDITAPYTRHNCIIHQTSLHHTRDNAVSSRHHCIIHQTTEYHKHDNSVSYTTRHCIIHQTSLYHSPDMTVSDNSVSCIKHSVSYARQHCIIHHTSMYHKPDIIVWYTRNQCIMQQTTVNHTQASPTYAPNKTVSYRDNTVKYVQQISLYGTPCVIWSKEQCIIQPFTLYYTPEHCIIHWTARTVTTTAHDLKVFEQVWGSLVTSAGLGFDDTVMYITVSYTRHHCIIQHSSLYHTADNRLLYTRHHYIIHPISLYRAPDITVSKPNNRGP